MENMSDYIVYFIDSNTKRIRQVGRIETENGCLYFYYHNNLLAVFSIANIVGVVKN